VCKENKKMAKSEKTRIEFDYDGRHYKLEYTANSLKKLEQSGVSFKKLEDMIFTAPEVLFRGAFYANHPAESEKKIREMYKALRRTMEDEEAERDDDGEETDLLIDTLAEMIKEAVEEISGRGGNVAWKVTR
jgi:hypothetical protein